MFDSSIPQVRGARSATFVEPLETRRLLSHAVAEDGPVITGETFIGPATALTAVVLQFNQHLDPATANNLKAYHVGRYFASSDSGGFDPIGFLAVHKGAGSPSAPFVGINSPAEILHPHAALGSVTYDDATQTVTILAAHPFRASYYLRWVHVAGTGPNAIRNSDGIALDGADNGHPGSQADIKYRFAKTRTFSYTDAQNNHITLKLSGPGQLMVFLPRRGDPSPLVFLNGTTADSSTLTGAIKPGKNSDGTTTFQELSGTTIATVDLPASFKFDFTQP